MKQPALIRRFGLAQFSFYSVIGVINTGIDAGLYWVLTRYAGVDLLLASMISFVAGTLNSFLMNKKLTFGDATARKMDLLRQYGRFLMVSSAVMVLHQINLVVFHYGLGLPDLAAKFLGIGTGVVVGYVLNKYWVFNLASDNA